MSFFQSETFIESTLRTSAELGFDVANLAWDNYYSIIIGGTPVTGDYANTIGATGYADNAVEAVSLCRELVATVKITKTQAV